MKRAKQFTKNCYMIHPCVQVVMESMILAEVTVVGLY